MTEKELKDTIVSQALETAKLRERLDLAEWLRDVTQKDHQASMERNVDLQAEVTELKANLEASERAWDEMWERVKELEAKKKDKETLPNRTPDDFAVGLTD